MPVNTSAPPASSARRLKSASCPRAGEIRRCAQLRELSLEANRLSAPVIDLRALAHLRSLQLFGNPLEFLPELTPCSSLRHLSLANVRPRGHPSIDPPCTGQPASGPWCQVGERDTLSLSSS